MTRRKFARRLLGIGVAGLAAYAGYEWYWYVPKPPATDAPTFTPSIGDLPPGEAFAQLARTDVIAMLEMSLTRYAREVKGYRATLRKQERIGGVLHDPETIEVCIAHDPTRVRMIWDPKTARKDRVGTRTLGALYIAGQNNNQTTVWRPDAPLSFRRMISVDPKDSDARRAARYAITDLPFDKSMLRTLTAWKKARDRGDPAPVYVGQEMVEQAGGRLCHVIRRTCPVPEIDSFSLDELPSKDAEKIQKDGHSEVTMMIDAETWLQVGTTLKRADGEPTASYYFRDIERNPAFPPDTFTVEALKKK